MGRVYARGSPATLQELRDAIQEETAAVPIEICAQGYLSQGGVTKIASHATGRRFLTNLAIAKSLMHWFDVCEFN